MQALERLNEEWQREATAVGPPHSGEYRHRPPHRAVAILPADAALPIQPGRRRQLASRLEGQCKTYGVGIIIGEKTRAQVPDHAVLELDLIMVKGKTEPERVYALLGDIALAKTPAYHTLVQRQAVFLAHYRTGGFVEAMEKIDACQAAASAVGWQQGYYDMMRVRIDGLIDDSPPDWTGVYVAKEK
jgi:adenylate cyclase